MRKIPVVCVTILSFLMVERIAFCDISKTDLGVSKFSDSQKSKINRITDEKIFKKLHHIDEKTENSRNSKYIKVRRFIRRACIGGIIFGIILLFVSKNSKIRGLSFSTLTRIKKVDSASKIFKNFDQPKPKDETKFVAGVVKNLPILIDDLKVGSFLSDIVSDHQLKTVANNFSCLNSGAIQEGENSKNLDSQFQSIVSYPQTVSVNLNSLSITNERDEKIADFLGLFQDLKSASMENVIF